jgi:hypothetical protein
VAIEANASSEVSTENRSAFEVAGGTKRIELDLTRMVQIDVLEKPIERIKKTCAMVGIAEKFDRALPDLETFLEAEVARGETRETRLTFDGLIISGACWTRNRSAASFRLSLERAGRSRHCERP